MLTIRRHHFSLIELLVVLTIIGIVAGAVGINSKKALNYQRFQTEVSEFTDRLRLAQNLMLIADADVHFKIEASEKGITYKIETDTPFSPQFNQFIKKEGTLKTIHHISHPSGRGGLIDLKFLSGGSVMTEGNIQLASRNQDSHNLFTANIMLQGFPSAIIASEKIGEYSQEASKDANMTRMMVQEIQMVNHEKKVSP